VCIKNPTAIIHWRLSSTQKQTWAKFFFGQILTTILNYTIPITENCKTCLGAYISSRDLRQWLNLRWFLTRVKVNNKKTAQHIRHVWQERITTEPVTWQYKYWLHQIDNNWTPIRVDLKMKSCCTFYGGKKEIEYCASDYEAGFYTSATADDDGVKLKYFRHGMFSRIRCR